MFLKLNNINISGGNISYRHLISSTEFDLFMYLMLFFGEDIKTLKQLINDNFSELLKGKPKLKVNKLRFYYIHSTKSAYIKYLDELVSSENLHINMLNYQEDKKT